jgi:hypothetical protein
MTTLKNPGSQMLKTNNRHDICKHENQKKFSAKNKILAKDVKIDEKINEKTAPKLEDTVFVTIPEKPQTDFVLIAAMKEIDRLIVKPISRFWKSLQ